MTVLIELEEIVRLILDVIDEDDAIGVVDLVLKDAGQKTFGGHTNSLALDIQLSICISSFNLIATSENRARICSMSSASLISV